MSEKISLDSSAVRSKKDRAIFLIVYRNMLIAKINPNLKTSRVYLYFHKRTKI